MFCEFIFWDLLKSGVGLVHTLIFYQIKLKWNVLAFYYYRLIQYEMVSGAFVWRAGCFVEERKEGRASFYEQEGIATVILINHG